MENAKISNLYNLDETIAKEYLLQFTYPWEALAGISDFIKEIGPTLDPEIYEKRCPLIILISLIRLVLPA